MSPVIRVTDAIFSRLEKHAVGFDTPANVINKLLDAYESRAELTKQPLTTGITDKDLVEQAFENFFSVHPRPFGQKSSVFSGFSDNNKGVQWNISLNKETGEGYLGVNLEGMAYDNWPISNLLINELDEAKLLELVNIDNSNEIHIEMTRDAWQAAARPPIKEHLISPEGLFLSELSADIWKDILDESLGCLNSSRSYKARGKQIVTRTKSGDSIEMEVSPHLRFYIQIWEKSPLEVDEIQSRISQAHSWLLPLYNFVEHQSK